MPNSDWIEIRKCARPECNRYVYILRDYKLPRFCGPCKQRKYYRQSKAFIVGAEWKTMTEGDKAYEIEQCRQRLMKADLRTSSSGGDKK